MSIENYIEKADDVSIEPYNGKIEKGEHLITEVELTVDDHKFKVELGSPTPMDEVNNAVLGQLASQMVEKKVEDEKLVPHTGGAEQSVSGGTQIMQTLVAVSVCQPATSKEIRVFMSQENISLSNAQYRGFVKPVANEGNRKFYCLTIEGWKQVIGIMGVRNWKGDKMEYFETELDLPSLDDKDVDEWF